MERKPRPWRTATSFRMPPKRRPLVAVLACDARTADAATQRAGAAAAEALRLQLAHLPQFSTILISRSFLQTLPWQPLERACRRLRIGYVVSVRCHGPDGTAALYVELARARRWNVMWAQMFYGPVAQSLVPGSATLQQLLAGLGAALRPRRRS